MIPQMVVSHCGFYLNGPVTQSRRVPPLQGGSRESKAHQVHH